MKNPGVRDVMMQTLPLSRPEDSPDDLARLTTLLRYATSGAWALALYDTITVQKQIIAQLRAALVPLPVLEERLGPDCADPLPILRALHIGEHGAPVVCLTGVEESFPDLFGYLDLQRELLALMPHRLILWVTDYGWRTLARRAPNFYSRRSGVFDFQTGFEASVEQLRRDLPLPVKEYMRPPQKVANDYDRTRRINLLIRRIRELETLPGVNPETVANSLYDLGSLYRDAGRPAEAADAFTRAASFYARRGQPTRQAVVLLEAGLELTGEGAQARAGVPLFEQAAAAARAGGDHPTEALALRSLGDVYFTLGDLPRADEYYRQARAAQAGTPRRP